MRNIIEISVEPTNRIDVVRAVRDIVGGSIADLRTRLTDGQPLLVGASYDSEFAEQAKPLISAILKLGLVPVLVENGYPITVAVLMNLFRRSDEELERQERLIREEADADGQDS